MFILEEVSHQATGSNEQSKDKNHQGQQAESTLCLICLMEFNEILAVKLWKTDICTCMHKNYAYMLHICYACAEAADRNNCCMAHCSQPVFVVGASDAQCGISKANLTTNSLKLLG